MAVEHHELEVPFWTEPVTGLDPEYMGDGYVKVPERRAWVDLNVEAVEAHLRLQVEGSLGHIGSERKRPKGRASPR